MEPKGWRKSRFLIFFLLQKCNSALHQHLELATFHIVQFDFRRDCAKAQPFSFVLEYSAVVTSYIYVQIHSVMNVIYTHYNHVLNSAHPQSTAKCFMYRGSCCFIYR